MALKYDPRLISLSHQLRSIQLTINLGVTNQAYIENCAHQLLFINEALHTFYRLFQQENYSGANTDNIRFVVYLTRNFIDTLKKIFGRSSAISNLIPEELQGKLQALIEFYQNELQNLLRYASDNKIDIDKELVSDDEYRMLFDTGTDEDGGEANGASPL